MTLKTDSNLVWPTEQAGEKGATTFWQHSGSNICLDFHGDPCRAGLAVFSDGNHHMALEESLQAFLKHHPEAVDIFYATTPPGVLVDYLNQGQLNLGNLTLSRLPDIFIGPDNILQLLLEQEHITSHRHFMQSRGNIMLVAKDNPRAISGIADLLREDVRLFISNPKTENASYQVYKDTIIGLANEQGLNVTAFKELLEGNNIVFGERIHHRELPQAIANNRTDVAIVYYHLALRYTRIFPELFDLIPLEGDQEKFQPGPANVTSDYHVGIINPSNPFATTCVDFLLSDTVTKIYEYHGLIRA